MKKLYDNTGHIKIDLIEKALINAKNEGKLSGVTREKIKYFIKSLEKEIEEHRSKVGRQITSDEMKYLFKDLARNNYDKVLDSELRAIGEILLDKNFDLD